MVHLLFGVAPIEYDYKTSKLSKCYKSNSKYYVNKFNRHPKNWKYIFNLNNIQSNPYRFISAYAIPNLGPTLSLNHGFDFDKNTGYHGQPSQGHPNLWIAPTTPYLISMYDRDLS
ncbi:MAG: hypothetical protein CR994_04095 [Maribacter sp.]|nr:MAG: hypothetical protein CR994_04095 [Maribacter sp.]